MKTDLTILENPPVEPVFSDVPQVVGVEITGRCNLRCRHCFNNSRPDHDQELPLTIIAKLLDEIKSWGVQTLRITGGEPTVHREFREIVDACRQRRIGVAVNTNGIYSQELLNWLETAPIDLFLVSIDGLEAANDSIRGDGTFRRAIDTCRMLRQAGQKVMISLHIGELNRSDVAGLTSLAAEMGVDIKMSPIRPVGRAAEEFPDQLLRPHHLFHVLQELTHLRRRHPDMRILTDFDILDHSLDKDSCGDPFRASCKAGRTMININYDGGIYPCAYFVTGDEDFAAGNIYRDNVTEVWRTSPGFLAFRTHQKSLTCRACCHYRRRCTGGCPAVAYWTTGRLDAHDPTCCAHLAGMPDQAR